MRTYFVCIVSKSDDRVCYRKVWVQTIFTFNNILKIGIDISSVPNKILKIEIDEFPMFKFLRKKVIWNWIGRTRNQH